MGINYTEKIFYCLHSLSQGIFQDLFIVLVLQSYKSRASAFFYDRRLKNVLIFLTGVSLSYSYILNSKESKIVI